MGWLAKHLNKETDLLQTIHDLAPWMNAIGFTVEDLGDIFHDGVLLNRRRFRRGCLELTGVWNGKFLTFLQVHRLTGEPSFSEYQRIHSSSNYFVITYGGPGHTVAIKHSALLSRETPILAASIERVMLAWDQLDISAPTSR